MISYSDGAVLPAASLNSDNTNVRTYANDWAVWKDVAGANPISVTHTWTATQTMSPASGAAFNVTVGGYTVTGNSTITGTLNVSSVLTGASLVCAGTTTFNTVALTWPGANAAGLLRNNGSGTLSWDTSSILLGNQTTDRIPRATGVATLTAGAITDNGTFLTAGTQPRALALRSSSYDVPASATGVTWSSAPLNVGTLWAGGAATRLTVPASAGGSYDLFFSGQFSRDAGDAAAALYFRKNGTTTIGALCTHTFNASDGQQIITLAAVDDAAAGDYYELVAHGVDGGTNLEAGYMSIRKVW